MTQPALKRIPTSDLLLGMHLHALDGPLLEHPFWRTRFTLTDAGDIAILKSSRVSFCWIDTNKGLDARATDAMPTPAAGASLAVAPEATPSMTPAPATAPAPAPAPRSAKAPKPVPASMSDELQRAGAVIARSRGAVHALFREARLGRAIDTAGCLPLVDDISASVLRNPGALISLARLKTQDDYTYMHSVAVCALMVALAREYGFDDDACRQAGLAGMLHDVGKAAIPLTVLNKSGRLDETEWLVMRTHAERGHVMLNEARGASTAAMDVCLHHHERMDGKGYPHCLAGEDISLLARMGAVCDVYDAITSERPYKTAWDPAQAIAQMASWKGQFDPAVFSAFLRSLGIYPVGSLVRLASGRLAVVTEHHRHAVLTPTVRAFYSTRSNMPIPLETIDLSQQTKERIVARESRADWNFEHLETLWGAEPPRR